MTVPYFKPDISDAAIDEVADTLRSGWLTTGPKTRQFEKEFAEKLGVKHAIALNSCTAALHLALEAIGLKAGELVIVPAMTFAATAEVVRYFDAIPVFVDCYADTFCMDVAKTKETLEKIKNNEILPGMKDILAKGDYAKVRAMIPMHYGGQIADVESFMALAYDYDIEIIEDAAHCLPAYYYAEDLKSWKSVGHTAAVTCFSFYANKCITTGEGGMAVTNDDELADRMRSMSLHGLSKDAWKRFDAKASWYYEITAPGFKYNLTDMASALGLHQLRRSNEFWENRSKIAFKYLEGLSGIPGLGLPVLQQTRQSSWHLYPIHIDAEELNINRGDFIEEMQKRGIGSSVHWMPLHMHPYYRETYGYEDSDFPIAQKLYEGFISLPLFPSMSDEEVAEVIGVIKAIIEENVT